MGQVSAAAFRRAIKTARSDLRDGEESFGSVLTDIAKMLYPPPKTAAQVAAAIGCTERNAELCLAGRQNWSGDAVAVLIAEILKRHGMRNARVIAR
jgi:hypothetical protein